MTNILYKQIVISTPNFCTNILKTANFCSGSNCRSVNFIDECSPCQGLCIDLVSM